LQGMDLEFAVQDMIVHSMAEIPPTFYKRSLGPSLTLASKADKATHANDKA